MRTVERVAAEVIENDDPRWIDFVAGHPLATVFHRGEWAEVLSDAYGYRMSVLALVSDGGHIVAGLPFASVRSRLTGARRIGLPFTDHSPPLCSPGWEERFAAALLEWASSGDPVVVHAELPVDRRLVVSAGVRHLLPLGNIEALEDSIGRTAVGRALRKAERSPLQVHIEHDLDSVKAFYRLHCGTRQRQGVPVQPWRFFRSLHERVIARELGAVFIARLERRPVAGAVFLGWNGTLVYKYGASDVSQLDLRPNNLVIWRAISWGSANRYTTLDFGKTDSDNEGLRRFKRGWGADEIPHLHTVVPAPAARREAGITAKTVAAFVRHTPPITGRLIGELLYGHYA